MRKEEIRRRVKAQKSLLSMKEKSEAAAKVFDALEHSAAFMLADNILLYHSLPDELSTREFIDRWHNKKRFFLPRVNGVNLEVLPYDQSTLRLGAFHIEEPSGNELTPIENIEMVVVPAIAYDRRGNRVGRGKGFYDRLLADTKATKVGVAYDFQLVDDIEAEPHDVKVDVVITESRVITVRHENRF